MSNTILREILDDVRGNMFSIMADKYTDVSDKKQLTFYLRWVYDNLEVFEKFLGFYEIPNISCSTIVSVLKDILTRYNLTLDLCRSQCYDGASNMLGMKSGVAAQIKSLQLLSNYAHCHALFLSLSVKDVTKSVKIFKR